jgi:hypothetical protein
MLSLVHGFWMVRNISRGQWKSRKWRTRWKTNSRSNTWHERNSSWIDLNWSSNNFSDDGRRSIASFGSSVRPQFQERGRWFLLNDDARPHTAVSIKQFLAKQRILKLNHFPYSLDSSPTDFFLFPKIKSTLKARRFKDTEDITRNVTEELLELHGNEFKTCFQ